MKIIDDVKEMGMYDLAHNQFFVKNQEAWYRDFEREISCRDLIREICENNQIELDSGFQFDEDFDELMYDWLRYGTDNLEGIIAMYYTAMWAMANIRERLKEKDEGCVHCEDGAYYDIMETPHQYTFCPMCGKRLSKN